MNRKKNTKLDDAITGEAEDFRSTYEMRCNTTTDTSTPSDVLRQFTPPSQQGIETRKEPTVIVQMWASVQMSGGVYRDRICATTTFNLTVTGRRENRPLNDLPTEHSRGHTRSTHNKDCGPSYMDLGDYDQQCHRCGCLFWYNEQLKGSRYSRRAEYHLCCGGGKIYMHPAHDPQVLIQQLLRNSHFMEHIRAYNQMFSMTSFGEKIDGSVNKGRGPYVFQISGQIYHWIGSLCLEEGHHPRFLQLYIHDTQDELNNRMYHFGGPNEGTLNPEIVEGLIHVLDEHNGLVQ
ncbi:hypothetical protein Tco_0650113 [Tanacetum coccineum]